MADEYDCTHNCFKVNNVSEGKWCPKKKAVEPEQHLKIDKHHKCCFKTCDGYCAHDPGTESLCMADEYDCTHNCFKVNNVSEGKWCPKKKAVEPEQQLKIDPNHKCCFQSCDGYCAHKPSKESFCMADEYDCTHSCFLVKNVSEGKWCPKKKAVEPEQQS